MDKQVVSEEQKSGRGQYERLGIARGPYSKNNLQRLRLLAQEHTETAIARIVDVMNTAENPMVVLAAAGMILDRGYGRAREYIQVDAHENITVEYQSIEAARAALIADGYPLDKLEAPKIIERVDDK